MKREIIITADGSTTIHLPEWNEQYHSKHGAIQEAYHVFIKHGFNFLNQKDISILEMGLGTGLNAFITFLEAERSNIKVTYTGIEAYPVEPKEIDKLNYISELEAENFYKIFRDIHTVTWDETHSISSYFSITKRRAYFEDFSDTNKYHLIYFDAFGARVQPNLWSEEIFIKMYHALKPNGVLVTYAAKGSVRRAMQSAGFKVERLLGPPGKREMLRAIKPVSSL